MVTLYTLAVLLSLSPFTGGIGDAASRKEETVSVTVRLSHDGVHAGADLGAALLVRVGKGWHINSASPSDENLVATAAAFAPPPGFAVAGTEYPAGVVKKFAFSESPLDVYEGTVIIRFRISVDRGVSAGAYQIPVDVAYQACNNDLCLAPSTSHVVIPVNVVAPGVSPAPVNPELFGGTDRK